MNIKIFLIVVLLLNTIYCQQLQASQYRVFVKENNNKFVEAHNKKEGATYKMRLHSRFADKSFQEIKATYFSPIKLNFTSKMVVEAPNRKPLLASFIFGQQIYVNWTAKGVVPPVINQGYCGSCYAHTGIADIQSSYLMKGLKVSLSIQQIIDCSSKYSNEGCNGGWMANVFDFAKINGVTTSQAYPMRKQTLESGKQGKCQIKKGEFRIKNYAYTSYRLYDCQSLTGMVFKRPVSVGVLVNFPFVFYDSGIFGDCDPVYWMDMNHALLVVGINKDPRYNYWICRNSWGVDWGQQGYVKLDRFLDSGNQCQICLAPLYSVV